MRGLFYDIIRPKPNGASKSIECLVPNPRFSLHAQTLVQAKDRKKLEKLIRYLARPAVANKRLSWSKDKRHILLELNKAFRNGTSHIQFTPLELLEKLAALVPPPRNHLVRYHGILGPHDAHRSQVVIKPKAPPTLEEDTPSSEHSKKRRISWAKLLARVFNIDVEVCSSCGRNVRIVAAITAKSTIQKILTHINLPLDPPMPDPARAPPQLSFSDVDAGTFDDSADFDQRSPENY